jgi:DNA-binding transcriptional LysR family regulator
MTSIYRPRFDLDAVRSFVAVAELNGFTAAADALAKTQSTVSHQIRKLEKQLGKPLLARTTRNIALTPAGETFLADARALLTMAEKAESRLLANQLSGEVRLGVPEEVASSVLPAALSAFRRQQPNIRVAITVGVSGSLKRAVDGGELNLALVKHAPAPRGALAAEPLCWAGDPLLATLDPLPVAFFPEPCVFRSRALEALQQAGRCFDVVMTTTSHQSLRAIGRSGLALTVLAISDCPEEIRVEPGVLRKAVLPDLPTMGYTIATATDVEEPTKCLKDALATALLRARRRF